VVFGVSALVGRLAGSTEPGECAADEAARSAGEALRSFGRALGDVSLRTVPVLVLGILASVALAQALPLSDLAGAGRIAAIALVAALAVPLALPTFAEIPLAAALLAAGAPAGAAVALFVAGPTVNLPSLLTVAKRGGVRPAIAVGTAVAVVAFVSGSLVQLLTR
jgi:hypothetical protein